MAGDGCPMTVLGGRYCSLAGFNRIEEVADVQVELLIGRSLHLERFGPRLGLPIDALRASSAVPFELRNQVRRIALHVRSDAKHRPFDCQAALGSKNSRALPAR